MAATTIHHTPSDSRFAPGLALLLIGVLGASTVEAATYCVSTAGALQSAISSANNDDEGTVQDIRIRPGTYNLPNGLDFEPAGDKDNKDFSITGGWNSNCSARTINPAATILNGENGSNDGAFYFFGNQKRFVVEGISFRNFTTVFVTDVVCAPFQSCPDTDSIRVRYNEFRGGRTVVVDAHDAQTLTVSNNLVADLNLDSPGTSANIGYYNNESPPTIAHNTFAGINCTATADRAVQISSERAATLHHNIFESDCASDLRVGDLSQPMSLRNNLYGTRTGPVGTVANNEVTQDPRFINAATGDYRLRESAPASVAINQGMTPQEAVQFGITFPAQDLDGPAGARLVGSRIDMGAYESSINDASVLTVINNNDSGAGSLRAAITSANATPGLQKIEFNIAGGCTVTPHLILLSSPLPDIIDSVEIDGYSEPETQANTLTVGSDAILCVVIAADAGTLAQALQVPNSAPAATSLTVKGIAFAGSTGFNGNFSVALRLRGGSDHLIQGNAFAGTGPGAIGPLGEMNFGIQIRDSAQNALIGGPEPEHRNSFGAMSSSAIVLNDATSGGHTIQNNYIGLTAVGNVASPIGLNGIFASASPNVRILDNVISSVGSNAALSITGATATGYEIARNKFGVSAVGVPTAAFRNGTGISIAGGSGGHQIGGILNSTVSNTITNSDGAGVLIGPTAGTGISVRPNRIYANGVGGSGLGIDLGALGPLENDSGDSDTGPNNGQNKPVLTGSLPNPDGTRQVTGFLNTQTGQYIVDIYRSPDCPGGRANMLNLVGTQFVTNLAGVVSINLQVTGSGAPGILSAVATRVSNGDSSEVSECFLEPIATTTTITNDSPDPSEIGQDYTVTAIVLGSGNPTGTITIDDGQGNQCTDSTLSGGIGSCVLPSTTVGQKTLTASYGGSVSHAPSSDTDTHTVVPAATTTTIVSDLPDPSMIGQPYTVLVQVRTAPGNTATAGGQVTVSDGNGQTCQIASLSGGNGSCQLNSVAVGPKTLTANYAGAINFEPSSDTESHTVIAASTTTTITADTPDPSQVGQAYTVSVTVTASAGAGTPVGAVAIDDGSGASCNAFLTNGSGSCQLSSTSVGAKTLTASYPGTPMFTASSDTEAHSVSQATTVTTITSDDPDPSLVGQLYTAVVTVTSGFGTPSGTVTVNDGTGSSCSGPLTNGTIQCGLISTTGGTKTLTATYAGNATYAGSSDTDTHTVQAIATVTTITADTPDPSTVGQSYNVTVTIDASTGGVFGPVQISDGTGASCLADALLGAASCSLTSTTPGSKTLTANFLGNATFLASSDTEPHTVTAAQAAATATAINSSTPNPSRVGEPYTVSVTISSNAGTPTGSFTVNDGVGAGSSSCQGTLVNGSGSCQLTSITAGGKSLTACMVPNASFAGSCNGALHQVSKADTDLSFGAFQPAAPAAGQAFSASINLSVLAPGAGTPTGTVTISASGPESCQITLPATSCTLTLTTPGMRTVTATYAGDANFNASVRQTQLTVLTDDMFKNGFE